MEHSERLKEINLWKDSKMYILVKEDIPDNFVPVITAHAALKSYVLFKDKTINIEYWFKYSFKKVVCKVNDKELELAKKEFKEYCELTESNLNSKVVAVVFVPNYEFPKCFKFFKLWSPSGISNEKGEKIKVDFNES